MGLTALYELGTHNPLAARIGKDGESEMALAVPLLSALQSDWLLIADRYYGVAKFVSRLLALPSKPNFLVRARANLSRKFIHSFRDGSCLIEIRDAKKGSRVQVREIYARVRRRSGRWVSVRLWTNLVDPHTYPAAELVRLYAMRWEHESAYKEIKLNLRRTPLLLSHTLTSAAQEVSCLLLAQTIVARLRLTAAGKECPPSPDQFHPDTSPLPLLLDDYIGVQRPLAFRTPAAPLSPHPRSPRATTLPPAASTLMPAGLASTRQ